MAGRISNIGKVALYGVVLGVGVFALQWLEYRFTMRAIALEAAAGLVGALFLGLGVWFGLAWHTRRAPPPGAGALVQSYGLTKREASILQLMADGASNKQIARTLKIAPNTVKTHVARILRKLDVDNRTQAATLYKAGTPAGVV